jgi:hypothetical protein
MRRTVALSPNLLTAEEYADLAGISLRAAYYRAQTGAITTCVMGTRTLFVADMPLVDGMGVPTDAVLEYRDLHGDPLVKRGMAEEAWDDTDG